jgi:large subunit ribosomal protein L6
MGKKPVAIVDGVSVEQSGADLTVKGPKGSLSFSVPEIVDVSVQDAEVVVSTEVATKQAKAAHGMVRSILQSMVTGVSTGFRKELECQGVGYRGTCSGSTLTLNLGYSHPVVYDVPEGVQVNMPDQTHIVVEGIDKQKVGQVAATIRGFRPPDAYKGKGIRYTGEQISLKEGKTVG